jgi:hypothetical protein
MRVVQILHPWTLPAMKDNTPCTMTWRLVLGALLAASSSACSGDELPLRNVGNTSDGLEVTSPVTTPVLIGNARFEGHWLGQTRDPLIRDAQQRPMDYAFPSGSRQVVLELALQGDVLEGSITFGSGVPSEPEAGVSYPPGVNYGLSLSVVNPSPIEGLAYPLTDVNTESSTGAPDEMVLSYPRFAGFADWCPLQPALPRSDGGYACVSADGAAGALAADGSRQCTLFLADGSQQPIDCDYLSLCLGFSAPCACDADGCAVDGSLSNRVLLQLIDGEIAATFSETVVDAGRLGDIRFQRAAN